MRRAARRRLVDEDEQARLADEAEMQREHAAWGAAHLHCRNYRRGGHDRPLRAGIHAAARPVLGPGGDRLREEAFALGAFAGQFPRPADGLGLPAGLGLGRLLVSGAGLHFPEDALALHLLLEGLQRLIDVVVPDHDYYDLKLSIVAPAMVSHAG